jgi:SRSO17 transposase
VLDEVFFSKKGDKSAGVARQLNSHNGQIENGQVGVFLSYNSPTGDVLLDRELYLPPEWETDTERRNQTVIPDSVKYLDKAELGIQMLTRTLAAGVPFRWLAGSSIYGNSSILREWLNVKTIPYLFQIDPDQIKWPGKGFRITGKGLNLFVNALEKTSWETIKYQKYNQGQATFQWNYTRVEGLQSRTDWQTWLLVRRNPLNSKELSYYLVSAPSSTSLAEMVKVEEQLWVTNNLFKVVRAEVGLDQYEVRFWQGWYRHITLAMAAYLYHVTNQNQVLAGVGSYGK